MGGPFVMESDFAQCFSRHAFQKADKLERPKNDHNSFGWGRFCFVMDQ